MHSVELHSVIRVRPAIHLSLNEWAVLGLVAEGETHGFAVSSKFAHDGLFGRIWTIPRPLVYRAIDSLVAQGLVIETGSAPGAGGPPRRVIEVTKSGRVALDAWLAAPVAHVRDARSELLMKLFLLERAGRELSPLLEAQWAALSPMLDSLRERLSQSVGFDTTVLRWRIYSTEALGRLLGELIEEQRGRPGRRAKGHAIRATKREKP